MTRPIKNPLLITKIHPPKYGSNLIIRTRLFNKIDSCKDCKLVLVNAPAGFGKTAMISSYISEKEINAAWVSLDETSNSPLIFFAYLIKSIHNIDSTFCPSTTLSVFSDDPPPLETILIYLMNELSEIKQKISLILDDYHLIENYIIHDLMEMLIANLPPNIQLVVLTRSTPKFSLSTIRLNNSLREIDAFDLRFSNQETTEFFQKNHTHPLPKAFIKKIEECTEGWVTGLQLASISHHNHPSDQRPLPEMCGDNRYISDFFMEEILLQQSDQIKDFLIQSSFLNQLSASLCNYVLEINNAAELLRNIEETNLFLFPLDINRKWYRYHNLFRDFLHVQLTENCPEEKIASLYKRGIKWYQENGFLIEAVQTALGIQDYEAAANLLTSNFDLLYNQPGMPEIVEKWLKIIPLETLRKHKNVWYGYILLLFRSSKFNQANKILSDLWGDAALLNNFELEDRESIIGYKALLNSILARHTTMNYQQIYDQSFTALSLLPKSENNKISISNSLHQFSAAFIDKEPSAGEPITTAQIEKIISNKNSLSVSRLNYFAFIAYLKGELTKSKKLYDQALLISEENNLQGIRTYGDTNIGLGRLNYEWNKVEAAADQLNEGLSLILLRGSVESLFYTWQAAFPILIRDNQINSLEEILERFLRVGKEYGNPPIVDKRGKAMQAQLSINQLNMDLAERWLDEFLTDHHTPTSLFRYEWTIIAKILVQEQQYKPAIEIFRQLENLAKQNSHLTEQIIMMASLSATFFQSGETTLALQKMNLLLTMIQTEGFIRSILDQSDIFQDLLQIALDSEVVSSENKHYVQKLLNENNISKMCLSQAQSEQADSSITPRELEVLQLLAQGFTYNQIANSLVISINTVRSYTKRIYQKLNVHNRMAAVQKWQKLHNSNLL